MQVDVAGPFGSDLSAGLGALFGAMKVVKSPLAIDYRTAVVRHPIRKRRRNWVVQRQQRPGIFVSEVLRTIYVHPEVYDKWSAGMYRRGDWAPNAELTGPRVGHRRSE
jgi:hypothetical protein